MNKSGSDAKAAVDALIPQRKNIKWLTGFQRKMISVMGSDNPLPHSLEDFDWLCFPKRDANDVDSDDYETESDSDEEESSSESFS